jgi:hypothetical protein
MKKDGSELSKSETAQRFDHILRARVAACPVLLLMRRLNSSGIGFSRLQFDGRRRFQNCLCLLATQWLPDIVGTDQLPWHSRKLQEMQKPLQSEKTLHRIYVSGGVVLISRSISAFLPRRVSSIAAQRAV